MQASFLAYAGYSRRALAALEEVEQLADHFGGLAFRTSIDPAAVWALGLGGRWGEALARADSASREFERSGEMFLLSLVRTGQAWIYLEQGELGEARSVLETVTDWRSTGAAAAWVAAGIDIALGHLDAARAGVLRALEVVERTGRAQVSAHLRERLVTIELEAGEPGRAAEQVVAMEELAAGDRATPWVACLTHRSYARVHGDANAARLAAGEAREAGLRFEAAVSEQVAGTLDDDGDVLRHSYEELRDIGAESWRRMAAAALRDRGLSVPRRRTKRSAGGLTATERHLARLVADGLTNRQIGTALHLSPKTVEVYLSRLYSKTKVASRIQLAVAVADGTIDVSEADDG
jgi:DNA-binding NarL/FixJ family response regulator